MARNYFLLFFLLLFVSCADNSKEATTKAIDIALSYLQDGECQDAIDVLEDAEDSNNPVYLKVLASAYACKAGFNTVSFLINDIANLNTSTQFTVMTGLTRFSTSTENQADSDDYVAMRTATSIIFDSTSGSPSQVARNTKFGSRHGQDMGVEVMLFALVNLGKFLHYYGNVNSSGVKGGGSNTNSCFIDYNDPRAQALTGVSTGACLSDSDGHPDLDQSTTTGKRRMCEGLTLLTNLFDVLDHIDVSGSSDLSKLETISTQVGVLRSAAVAAGLGTLISMTDQATCETYLTTPANLLDMEFLYALIFESGLQ
jgi:hypothetical protein